MSSRAQKRSKARRRNEPYATVAKASANPMFVDSDTKAVLSSSPALPATENKSPSVPTPPSSASDYKFGTAATLKPLPPTLRSRDSFGRAITKTNAGEPEKTHELDAAPKAEREAKEKEKKAIEAKWLHVPVATEKADQFIRDHFGHWGDSNSDDGSFARFKETKPAFGEIYPDGVEKVLGATRMRAGDAGCTTIVDLGCGHGKILVQALLQFPNVTRLVGVELMSGRVERCLKAFKSMVEFNPAQFSLTEDTKHDTFTLSFRDTPQSMTVRTLEIRKGNLFDAKDAYTSAQIVIFEVMLQHPSACPCGKHQGEFGHPQTMEMLRKMPVGARILTYHPFSNFAAPAENGEKDTVAVLHKACDSNVESRWKWISGAHEIRCTWCSNFNFQMLEKLS